MKSPYFLLAFCLLYFLSCGADPGRELPVLLKDLNSSDSGVRNRACLKIGSFGDSAEPAVPNLIKLLHDPNNGVRTSAAFALRSIGGEKAQKALGSYKKE